jgi:hypothetical protein
VPRKYLREATPNVTLTQLTATPEAYRGKLVLMGAVLYDEATKDDTLWLHVKNRPLDQDYRPQLPPSVTDPEAGLYWIVVGNIKEFPRSYHHWADMTVFGRVEGLAPGKEPIIKLIYVRGWGLNSQHDGVWEEMVDTNYIPYAPSGAIGELGPQ